MVAPRVETLAVPEGNPGALRSAARTFSAASEAIEARIRAIEGTVDGAVPGGWIGLAAFAFRASVAEATAALRAAPPAFRMAAGALETLANEIEAAQELARRAQAAAASFNDRAARLDRAHAAALADSDIGATMTLTGQAIAMQVEAAGIRTQATSAQEQVTAAAARAAATFSAVAAQAPSFARALETLAPNGDGEPGWDPIQALTSGSTALWWKLLQPGDECIAGPGSYGGIGSFIRGPDGLLYPLVVPRLTIDGVTYNGNRGAVLPWENVWDLGGTDPGWTEVYRAEGVTRLREGPSGVEKFFIAFAGMNPNLHPQNTPVDEEGYAALGLGLGGVPFMRTEAPPQRSSNPPSPEFHMPSPTFVMVDGELVMVDRNAPETWNREITRSGITPNRGVQRYGAAMGAADLAGQVGDGISLAQMSDDFGVAGYQVVFEVNDEGRRRAMLRSYQVSVNQEGDYMISPSHVTVGEDGEPAFDNILYRQGDEIRPGGDPGYGIIQLPEEEPVP